VCPVDIRQEGHVSTVSDETFGENLVYHVGHSKFELYETPSAGSAKNTQMNWMVDNLEDEMARMRAHGIEFEDYDVPGLRTVDGTAGGQQPTALQGHTAHHRLCRRWIKEGHRNRHHVPLLSSRELNERVS